MRTVGKVEFGFYASRGHLDAHGMPISERELLSHRLIGWSDELGYLAMAGWLVFAIARLVRDSFNPPDSRRRIA
jgi:hypothetical protein